MYEEQIEGLAELILELMPDRTHEKRPDWKIYPATPREQKESVPF